MRATRNATKNTPPPAKKAGKASTPVATRASTVEKQEQDPKSEPILIVEEEAVVETVTVEIKDESAPDANGADAAEKAKETPKSKPASAKKKVATPKAKVSEDAEKPADAVKAEGSTLSSAKAVTQQLKPEEVEANEEDQEMEDEEEGDEEGAEEDEQGEGSDNDEEAENEEEEDDEGEEDAAEEDGEGDGEEEQAEPRPVTERQKRKKLEVFVGGLDKAATEDDIKAAFSGVGEVVEVRLIRYAQTGKNKGYAFVRFANADQAKRAATELERTKILDKECAVVASDEDDTLFVGNICKTWKSDQVLEKLKEYEVEGIEEMSLMEDPKNEGSNRGFAFLELASHNDAVKAFKRLCKPDAIFGSDRSAKVAWAEPQGEPDEEVMAKVKSVFVNGMPSSWDEAKVKEHFGTYGDVERVVLAKNMPRSKRKDFGFVNYTTREAAVACIEALKDAELPDGEDMVKVKVALAKPAPRKKQMKGTRGGYPIGTGPIEDDEPTGRGKGRGARGGRSGSRRGRVGKGSSRGGKAGRGSGKKVSGEAQKVVKASKQKGGDTKPEEKSRDKSSSGARGARKNTRGGVTRFSRGGYSKPSRPSNDFNSQRSAARQGGVAFREDYMPRGARLTQGLLRTRGYAARPLPREDPYSRRLDRAYGRDADVGYGSAVYDYAEAGPGIKRPFSVLGEDAAYYESGRRGFPRARIDYADHGPVGGSHFTESIRAPLGRTSLQGRSTLSAGGGSLGNTGSGALYGSGGPGYSSVLSGGGDYTGVAELRGGSYSSLYGSRTGSVYGPPGGTSGSYY